VTVPASGTTAGYAAVAYGTSWKSTTPAYKRIDKSPVQCVTGFSVRRGRAQMTDAMDTGAASVKFVDLNGYLDPTNGAGPFTPMAPNAPIVLRLWNPTTNTWARIFTGFTQSCPQTRDYQSGVTFGSLECQDLFSMLAEAEVPPGIDYDNTGAPSSNANGDTRFASQNVDDHIRALLAIAAVPSGMQTVFSGNVVTLPVVYPAGTKILSALQDAADAEFSGVATHYIAKDGTYTFHGRYSRFNPTVYSAHTWHVGDMAYVNGGSGRMPLRSLSYDEDISKMVNASLFTPQGIADVDIAAQLVSDVTSIGNYGIRSFTGTDLITGGGVPAGDGLTSNQETRGFGTYWVSNFKDPIAVPTQAVFKWAPGPWGYASDLWNLLCNIEIGDVMRVNTTHPGTGGFTDTGCFVEGITYEVDLGPLYTGDAEATADVTLTVDLSPQARFTTAPTGWAP
jgi:hypothetical protein